MNFDGTYPEKESAGRLLRKENAKPEHPPVRVVVSYPQSEEWDGKSTNSFSVCKWIVIITSFVTIAAASILLYHFFIKNDVLESKDKVNILHLQKNALSDEDLKNYTIQQVTMHYDTIQRELSNSEQLQFFMNEIKTLESQNLTYFINELNIAITLLLPQNIDVQNEIIVYLYNYVHHIRYWLEYVIGIESKLTSYDYHKSDKLKIDYGVNNWSKLEIEELKKLEEKYTKPMDVILNDNVVEIHGNVVVFSDAINNIPGNSSIQQVTIVATILHMDSNFSRNIDFAIFAAEWKFTMPVIIDLSGADAPQTNLRIKNGAMGASGQSGGHFIAGGNLNLTEITIISNGGSAARGYDGKNGRNGVSNLVPALNSTNHQCIIPETNATTNYANETIQSFRVYNELSCGEEALKGGKSGEPGRGGKIIVFLPNSSVEKRGRNGAKAANGMDGADGSSAFASCYYLSYKMTPPVDLEHIISPKWSTITTNICSNATLLPLRRNELNKEMKNIDNKRNLNKLILSVEKFSYKSRDQIENENDDQLFLLLKNIESNSLITNLTSAISLFNEFSEIDKKYTKAQIFSSFSKKVNNILKHCQDGDIKHALEYLEVAVWTKMSVIRSGIGEYYIVDIDKYLDQLLSTVKKLDIEVLKVSTFSDQLKGELRSKFEKIQKPLEPISALLCESPDVQDSDRRIMCLVSTLSNIITKFVQISSRILISEEEIDDSFKTIKLYLNNYKEIKNKYYSEVQSNGTQSQECAEMMINKINCPEMARWRSFKKMDEAIFKAFEKLKGTDFLLEISYIIKIILQEVHESRAFSPLMHFYIREFRDSVDDFSALLRSCYRVSFDKLLQTKLEILDSQQLKKNHLYEIVGRMKQKILESLLRDQYIRAVRAYQQWAFPYTDTIEVIHHGAKKSELINAIQAIKDARSLYHSTIKDRDSQIIKAEFSIASNDPFYTWNNKDYNSVIVQLLKGRIVKLRSNIFDSGNILNKQSIKFQIAELRLTGVPKDVLKDYNVEMTHSGYSNYMYNGTLFTTVGPEVMLFHSFDQNRRFGVPRKYSLAYEKIKNGEIMLSPYTSWSVQLKPNLKADFLNLQKYLNSTDVHLVGFGSYIQMPVGSTNYKIN